MLLHSFEEFVRVDDFVNTRFVDRAENIHSGGFSLWIVSVVWQEMTSSNTDILQEVVIHMQRTDGVVLHCSYEYLLHIMKWW